MDNTILYFTLSYYLLPFLRYLTKTLIFFFCGLIRFLGYFKPQEGKPALWELDSDYYLHVSGLDDLLLDMW